MNKYLPSKKFVRFIGVIVAAGLVIWLVSFFLGRRQVFKNSKENTAIASGSVDNLYVVDSDSDGVYDWEEGLWGTNPHDPNSNGTGASDGDYIKARKKQIQDKNNLTGESDSGDSTNQTEMFARQLFSTASLARQDGGLSTEDLNAFSKSFGQALTDAKIKDPFSLIDLKLSAATAAEYKASLTNAFDPYLKAGISELDLIYNFSNGDATAPEKMDKMVTIYKDLSNNILKIQTPHNAAGIQLRLANISAKLAISFLNMKHLSDDPVVAMVGFRQYEQYSQEFVDTLNSLQAYFTSNGII